MQRDMDLVRELLLRIESLQIEPGGTTAALQASDPELTVGSHAGDQVDYHLELLINAGLVDGSCSVDRFFHIAKLTWSGHNLLDSIRDPEIWRQTKEAANKAGGFTVELLGDLARGFIKTQLTKYTGVEL